MVDSRPPPARALPTRRERAAGRVCAILVLARPSARARSRAPRRRGARGGTLGEGGASTDVPLALSVARKLRLAELR